jgi:phosphoribosylanthranilate isomerase
MVTIKICGITTLDDARVAVDAGADMLGFNFYRRSPRFIEPLSARELIAAQRSLANTARQVAMVGVFVNEPIDSVLRIAAEAGVDAIQLHGDESAEFCNELKARAPQVFLIKAFRVNPDFQSQQISAYNVDAIMLDAFDQELFGGTGRVIDWSMAARIRDLTPRLFLSGGLSPANVAAAIATVKPFGVDACSALEISPGRKDHERVTEFVRAARDE